MPPSPFPWNELIIRSERRSWFYLVGTLLWCAGEIWVAMVNPGARWQWSAWATAVLALVAAAYGAFCIVWHRRHRGAA